MQRGRVASPTKAAEFLANTANWWIYGVVGTWFPFARKAKGEDIYDSVVAYSVEYCIALLFD